MYLRIVVLIVSATRHWSGSEYFCHRHFLGRPLAQTAEKSTNYVSVITGITAVTGITMTAGDFGSSPIYSNMKLSTLGFILGIVGHFQKGLVALIDCRVQDVDPSPVCTFSLMGCGPLLHWWVCCQAVWHSTCFHCHCRCCRCPNSVARLILQFLPWRRFALSS